MKFIGLLAIFIAIFFPLHSQNESIDHFTVEHLLDSLQKMNYSEESYAFAEQINQLAAKRKDAYDIASIKIWLGKSYSHKGEYEKALEIHQQAITIGASLKNIELQAAANLDLGGTYFRLKEYDKALIYFDKALQQFRGLKDPFQEGKCLMNLGNCYAGKREQDKALNYYLLAKPIIAKNGSKKDLDKVNNNIAITYVRQGKPQKALPYFEARLEKYKANKDTFNFAAGYGNLAYNYQNIGDFKKAFIYYDSSLYYSNLLHRDEITYVTLLDMSDGYQLKGDYKNALKYHQQYHALSQKVISEKTKNSIAELEVKFDTEKKELALKESQKEVLALEQQAQIRRQRMALIIGGLILSLLLALFIFYKWKNDIKSKEVKAQLVRSELKNKQLESTFFQNQLENKKVDLTNLALDISRKNKFSDELIEKLEKLQKEKPENVKIQLRDIIQFAISHLQINEDLAILQKNVDQINQEFYQKMETKFGKLSSNEKYLSGLLRLNLTNKDIAAIRGISVNSAKMSRYRLRKKLGLKQEADIRTFLQKI